MVVELTDEDRKQAGSGVDQRFLDVVEEHGVQPATPEFFDAAELAEGALPHGAREAFANLRRGSIDALVIRGLPHDQDPGPTPRKLGETSSGPRRGHSFLAMGVRRLGYEFSYAMEKKGALVHHIHPTKEMAMSQSNASWQVDLSMHTENAFHPLRPDFVLLYCVRAPENAAGDPPGADRRRRRPPHRPRDRGAQRRALRRPRRGQLQGRGRGRPRAAGTGAQRLGAPPDRALARDPARPRRRRRARLQGLRGGAAAGIAGRRAAAGRPARVQQPALPARPRTLRRPARRTGSLAAAHAT